MDRHQVESTFDECVKQGYCEKWEYQSFQHRYSLTDKDENYFHLDDTDILNFVKDELTQTVKDMFLIDDEPKPIFTSTPEGLKSMVNQPGLYYRVRDKLNKLIEVTDYPDITNIPDNLTLECIILKFERDSKISGEDMKICNELWKKYGHNN